VLGLGSYYLHVVLVLVFLNLLPVSKHFHILLALPNLFLSPIDEAEPPQPVASSAEALLARVEAAMDAGQLDDAAIGKAKVEHWSFKERLDWFACTECGRCSDHCPAHRTGKSLSPKLLTLSLREQLKREESRLTGRSQAPATELVPKVIEPSVVWACTTCRACEEQCPVGVRYLDTIVGLRRDLVMMRGDAPPELHRAFDGMERNKNPWNFPNRDRLAWTVGLDVPQIKDVERVEYLYWVGCAASFDERNQRVARAFVRLMQQAGVTFAILGTEERCTGDSARRAGNELLFLQLAEENIRTLKGYLSEKRFERIVTACPHCLNTLGRDYADFGGKFDVVHHSVALEQWVREGRLRLDESIRGRATFHDPCTLARFANVVHEPRRLLQQIDGLRVSEPQHHGRQTLCCGGGGAQMWLEEQNGDRMNARRARELVETEAEHVVSACPFCLTMVSDGVKSLTLSSSPVVEDLAEILLRATRDGTPC
jgi:Fe-S oxidoreductase